MQPKPSLWISVLVALLLSGTWTAMSFVAGDLASAIGPFAVTYVVHSGYTLNGVVWLILRYVRRRRLHGAVTSSSSAAAPPLTVWQALLFGWLSIAVAATWYLSLPLTNVGSNNSVYNSAPAFVYCMSLLVGLDHLELRKTAAVCISVAGVCLISLAPAQATSGGGDEKRDTPAGFVWVILSTALYAAYEVLYSLITGHGLTSPEAVASARRIRQSVAACGRSCKQGCCGSSASSSGNRGPRSRVYGTGGVHVGVLGPDGLLPEPTVPLLAALAASAAAAVPPDDPSGNIRDGGSSAVSETAETAASDPILPLKSASRASTVAAAPEDAAAVSAERWLRAERAAGTVTAMGLVTLLTSWPLFFILDKTGVEPLVKPSSDAIWQQLAGLTGLDAVYNLTLLVGVALSSPLSTAVGTILVVPASLLADYAARGVTVSPQAGVGVALVLLAFIVLQVPLPAQCACAGLRRTGNHTLQAEEEEEEGLGEVAEIAAAAAGVAQA